MIPPTARFPVAHNGENLRNKHLFNTVFCQAYMYARRNTKNMTRPAVNQRPAAPRTSGAVFEPFFPRMK
jgi:hypothetical protein